MTAATYTPSVDKPVVPRHAIIGIIAVLLAAINSSLGGGMLGAGLEDLRGAWGQGIDDMAYVTTAFNASQMFMGPVAIMLAARFGHRKVLMFSGFVYAMVSLILPFAPRMLPVLFLLVIGGLSSGTFYPLCLSFIGRNLPITLMPFGIAAYTMDLLGTNHVVQALEGFYFDNWSWHWIFWNQAVLTIPMILCIYIGIPDTPKAQLIPRCRYTEVLYVGGGLSLIYVALDQGERLDWFNNGLINGLLIAGGLLLLAAIARRIINPNKFLDFSYLKARNILILGFLFLAFRLILLRAVTIIPLFLETLHQYRPKETGALLLLSLVPYLVVLPIVAWAMNRVHVRVVMTIGFALLGIINFHDSHALSTWIGTDFVVQQMIGGVGICMAIIGTMSGVIFEGRLTGAYRNRAGAYCQGAFFQICRLFGTEAVISALRRYILIRQHFWQTKLVSSAGNGWQYQDRLAHLGTALAPQAAGPLQRPEIAAGLIAGSVKAQAFTLAIDNAFMLLACVSVAALIAIFMMTKIPLPRELPEIGAAPDSSTGK